MKTTRRILIAALAGVALSMFANSAKAQYKSTGDDGITASPKLHQLLNERKAPPSAPAALPAMACAKCKTEVVSGVDRTARGANKPTMLIAKHLCKGCETTISTTGHGKASRDVVTHKCSYSGAKFAACCGTDKN